MPTADAAPGTLVQLPCRHTFHASKLWAAQGSVAKAALPSSEEDDDDEE